MLAKCKVAASSDLVQVQRRMELLEGAEQVGRAKDGFMEISDWDRSDFLLISCISLSILKIMFFYTYNCFFLQFFISPGSRTVCIYKLGYIMLLSSQKSETLQLSSSRSLMSFILQLALYHIFFSSNPTLSPYKHENSMTVLIFSTSAHLRCKK